MQTHWDAAQIVAMEQRYRAAFINSLGGFKSGCLVGTTNMEQQENLAIFNSIVHLGANPALIGMIVRPDSVERHTYENIVATKYYTLNHINQGIYKQAHQTAARYPRNISEFEATNLQAIYKDNFFAPYVQESHIQIGLECKDCMPITINNTILVIGQIQHIYVPDNCLAADGFIDLAQAGTLAISGLDSYHSTQQISRLSYAKPDTTPKEL